MTNTQHRYRNNVYVYTNTGIVTLLLVFGGRQTMPGLSKERNHQIFVYINTKIFKLILIRVTYTYKVSSVTSAYIESQFMGIYLQI